MEEAKNVPYPWIVIIEPLTEEIIYKNTRTGQITKKMPKLGIEVFRLDSNSAPPNNFDKNQYYAFALRTSIEGSWPNEKYYTTNPLQYLGKHVRSEEWGFGEGHGGAETFDDNGKETRIVYDYEGRTCFKIVPCKIDGGS